MAPNVVGLDLSSILSISPNSLNVCFEPKDPVSTHLFSTWALQLANLYSGLDRNDLQTSKVIIFVPDISQPTLLGPQSF